MIFIKQFDTAKYITLLMIQISFIQISLKNLNKVANHDMKQLNNCLSANKISLNVEKTELVIFKSPGRVKLNLLGKGYIHQIQ